MGLFDWLGGKKEKPTGAWKPDVKPAPPKEPVKYITFEELRPDILALVRPAWKPIVASEEGAAGATRFGGRPGLLPGEPWPPCGKCRKPMTFFLQVNLGESPGSFGAGLIQLFYCIGMEGECFDWEPFSKSQCVRLVDPAKVAFPKESPQVERFPARLVTGWTEIKDLPNWEEIRESGVELSDEYERTMERIEMPHQDDKLGGWPAWVQGIEYPDCPSCDRPMRLIFQLDSEDNVPFMWGDLGCGHITQCPQHPDVATFSWACS